MKKQMNRSATPDQATYVVYCRDEPVCLVTARSQTQAAAMVYKIVEGHLEDLDDLIEQGWPTSDDIVAADTTELGGIIL